MKIIFSRKYMSALLLVLFIASVQCSRPHKNKCHDPYYYGLACKCFENRPNFKQLECKNLSCNTELSGYLRYYSVERYNVRRLILENMDLKYIPLVFFDGFFMWIEISTSVLEQRLFQDVPENNKLEHLMLNEVKIADGNWDWQFISPLKKLTTLRMRKMPLGGLQNFELFEKSLKHIVLHGCDVRELRDDQFRNYKELEMLDIRHDRLKELKRSMFPTPSKLRIMIFRNNHLTSLPHDLFEGMRNLTVIDFQQNQLTVLLESTFKPVRSPVIFAQGNPLKCDCNMKWALAIKMIKGKCDEPELLKGKELSHISEEFSHC